MNWVGKSEKNHDESGWSISKHQEQIGTNNNSNWKTRVDWIILGDP